MKMLSELGLDSCCLHKKFLSRQDLFNRFFEINTYIDISTEPLEELTVRYNVKPEVIKNSTIYCSSVDSQSDNINTFPLYWMYKRPLVDYTPRCDWKFISLNGAPSTTRTALISKLKNAKVLDYGIYSLWPEVALPSEHNVKSHYDVKRNLPEEWYRSLFEFQIETCSVTGVPYFFISEKTFRPLLSGKPFLNYGYPGMYKKLKEYGFIFDCDLSFDEDTDNRFDLYVEEVIRLINKPLDVITTSKNKEIARELYHDNLEDLKEFEQKLDQLKDMIYLDKEMIEYLHV